MIRFILKRNRVLFDGAPPLTHFYTIDVECGQLERELGHGGYGEATLDAVNLVGAEIIPDGEKGGVK
jgi:hypothetical protein